ncbi:MAG: hypothetical protein EAY81_05855 [Bacteroidetes bacterium]|nr:MAG: hypothetical protein EAY81_05855 [Bacteroidota bacterium]
MNKSIGFFLLIGAFIFNLNSVTAQRNTDSLSVVNFFGTVYAVKSGSALTLGELKNVVKSNPSAFKEFKRARRFRTLSIALDVVSVVPFVAAIISDNSTVFWVGTGSAGLLVGSSILIDQGPYSRSIINTVKLYNESLRVR